jgi:hypothetical protein
MRRDEEIGIGEHTRVWVDAWEKSGKLCGIYSMTSSFPLVFWD